MIRRRDLVSLLVPDEQAPWGFSPYLQAYLRAQYVSARGFHQ